MMVEFRPRTTTMRVLHFKERKTVSLAKPFWANLQSIVNRLHVLPFSAELSVAFFFQPKPYNLF